MLFERQIIRLRTQPVDSQQGRDLRPKTITDIFRPVRQRLPEEDLNYLRPAGLCRVISSPGEHSVRSCGPSSVRTVSTSDHNVIFFRGDIRHVQDRRGQDL